MAYWRRLKLLLSARTAVAAVAALAAVAATARVAGAQPLPDRRALEGRAVRSDGKPVAGAAIAVQRTDFIDTEGAVHSYHGSRIVTDERGEFSITQAELGQYYLVADAEGYASASQTVTLTESSKPVRITMLRLTPLTLIFYKPDGTRLAGAKVKLYLRGPGCSVLPSLNTDASGKALLQALAPGSYTLRAVAPGVGAAAMLDLSLREGDATPLNVRLQRGGTLQASARESVEGESTHTTGDGRGIGGALLTFARLAEGDDNGAGAAVKFSDEATLYAALRDRATLIAHEGDGTVVLPDLLPGRYAVRFFAGDYEASAPRIVEIKPGEVTSVTLLLKLQRGSPPGAFPSLPAPPKPVEAALTLTDAQQAPLADMEFWFQFRPAIGADATNDPILPPPAPGMPQELATVLPGGPMRRGTTDAAGVLHVYPLRPGNWRVVFYEPRDVFAEHRTASLGGGDLEVTADGGQATLHLKIP